MILVIDNYDSFTYNLVDYIGRITDSPVLVHRNDQFSIEDLDPSSIEAVIISPGPKNPSQAGLSKEVVRFFYKTHPILGVCLGHQCIGEVFGAKVVKADVLMHGKTSMIIHTSDRLFLNISSPFEATRYHSLVLSPQSLERTPLKVIARSEDDRAIMAVVHEHFLTYGLQFHPESILTTEGLAILRNFLSIAAIPCKALTHTGFKSHS